MLNFKDRREQLVNFLEMKTIPKDKSTKPPASHPRKRTIFVCIYVCVHTGVGIWLPNGLCLTDK